MELVTHKKFKGGRLMPWGKGTVVMGAKGFVFLCGNTATTDDYDPSDTGGGALGDAATQWRSMLANIKYDLEELGTSLDHLIRLTFFVRGPFPSGGVLSSPNFSSRRAGRFFEQHCPKHCSYNNPPPSEVIGVAALAQPDIVIEIVAVAALPDRGHRRRMMARKGCTSGMGNSAR
jgi:enamine deaminase RidA (YjgF/YER057c/UK114 family)